MLSSNQWTEELPHDCDDAAKTPQVQDFHPYLPSNDFSAALVSAHDVKTQAYLHSTDQIPPNHSNEVVIPPPDVTL